MEKAKEAPRIPTFESEDEEREFWATHDSTEFFDSMEELNERVIDARPSKAIIPLRFDQETLAKLRELAAKKGIGYQTLMRTWIMERLAQELRRG